MPVRFIIVLILIILAVVLAVQNASAVPITFLFWSFDSSLALVLLLFFASGVAFGLLGNIPHIIKKKKELRQEKQKRIEPEKHLERNKFDRV